MARAARADLVPATLIPEARAYGSLLGRSEPDVNVSLLGGQIAIPPIPYGRRYRSASPEGRPGRDRA